MSDPAHIGQWSARRHRVNQRISEAQSYNVIIGATEEVDDGRSLHEWGLVIGGQAGKVSSDCLLTQGHLSGALASQYNQLESDVVTLASLCHAFLESLDRRRGTE